MGSNQYWAGRVYDIVFIIDGSTRRLTESGFMEKPGIEPATPDLHDIGLSPRFIPYTKTCMRLHRFHILCISRGHTPLIKLSFINTRYEIA